MLTKLTALVRHWTPIITGHLPFLVWKERVSVQQYLFITLLMVFALLIRLAIAPPQAGLQYVVFFPVVTLAAITGGFRLGLFATIIGLVFATYFFTPPYHSFSWAALKNSFFPNVVFIIDGLIVSFTIDAMHRYRQQYEKKLVETQESELRAIALNKELSEHIAERKKAEEEIYSLAFYDALTGLPNRRLFLDRLKVALSISARNQQYGAVLFLDMDKFKWLNDTLGHHYGDLMLIEIAERLKHCVRDADTVARFGGDEFVILIEEISANADEAFQKASQFAEKIRQALSVPYQLHTHKQYSSPSIGICQYRGNEASPDELIKRADMAMYQAKDSGRNKIRCFDPLMQQIVEARAALASDLRSAVLDQQFRLYYQIQLNHDQRPIGAEALVRWMHPVRGEIAPQHFIPFAEESSLILDIGNWVIETACRQIAAWKNAAQTRHLVLAINVSAQQFRQTNFVEHVMAMIQKYNIAPSRLKLELTESVALDDIDAVVEKMRLLREVVGVTLSLDDFGTGYSSLSYLKRLPIDQIKIASDFVHNVSTNPSDSKIVRAIIDMARHFGFNVIAEGIETEAQLDFLKKEDSIDYQGFLFGKPLPLKEFEAMLAAC